MFYVSKIEGKDKFYVTDTADNVTECLSRTDLIRAVDKGICIEGVMATKRNGKKDVSKVVSDDRFNKVVSKLGDFVYWVWDKDEYLFAIYVGYVFDRESNENYLCLYSDKLQGNQSSLALYIDKSFYRRTSIDGIIAVSVNKILFTRDMFIKSAFPTSPASDCAYAFYNIKNSLDELRKTHDLNSIELL